MGLEKSINFLKENPDKISSVLVVYVTEMALVDDIESVIRNEPKFEVGYLNSIHKDQLSILSRLVEHMYALAFEKDSATMNINFVR